MRGDSVRSMTLSITHASRAARVLVLACAAIAVGGSAFSAGRARASTPATFTPSASVDFAQSVKVRSLVGFLHGLSDSQPPDRLVVPLHPTLWRGSLASASPTIARDGPGTPATCSSCRTSGAIPAPAGTAARRHGSTPRGAEDEQAQ